MQFEVIGNNPGRPLMWGFLIGLLFMEYCSDLSLNAKVLGGYGFVLVAKVDSFTLKDYSSYRQNLGFGKKCVITRKEKSATDIESA
jgi:hypothetical protein